MNVTPFVDVLLVLLIVFIIAAPLATRAIKVDLAAGTGVASPSTPVNLMIDDRGAISFQAGSAAPSATNLATLDRDLTRASGADPGHSSIIVVGGSHTRYGAFMAVLDRLHTDGFSQVTLAAKTA
jgi:biopolymer transport protein ExbD